MTAANAPIRLGILDVNNDQKFDENDVAVFVSHFLDANGNPVQPTARDYSRFDLNGDGFTGGSSTEMFDLDRIGSTQYNRTVYGTTSQQIEEVMVSFDENQVTDMQVLCFYGYSPLYTGDPSARRSLLDGCAGVRVKVTPKIVTVQPGATQQFSVMVRGTNDPRVTWTASGGGNITDTGLFTAGQAGGTFKVRATSKVDTHAFDEATVTIPAASGIFIALATAGISPSNFCLPGPSTPGDPRNLPPGDPAVNVGPIWPGPMPQTLPVTMMANCREFNGIKNAAEVLATVTGSGNAVSFDMYADVFGSLLVQLGGYDGFASILFAAPITGTMTIAFNPGWLKSLNSFANATAVVSSGTQFVCRASGRPPMSCSGSAAIPVKAGQGVMVSVAISTIASGAGFGSGNVLNLTFAP